MAFETKAGLLIGIGFIVCFAVVLSHRAPGDQVSAQMAYQVLSRHGLKTPTETTTTMANEFARVPFRGGDLLPLSDEQANTEAASFDARPAIRRVSTVSDVGGGTPSTTPGAAQGDRTSSTPHSDDSAEPSVAKLSWDALFGVGQDEDGNDGPPATPAAHLESNLPQATTVAMTEGGAPASTTYQVVANDTLWGVARKAYGRADRHVVDCIYQANRKRMTSAGDLKPGTELVLPVIKGAGGPVAGRPENRHSSDPAPRKSAKVERLRAKTRTYDVKPGDRYATIAERVLGDKSRWREIYAMNKDIFPDPEKIQHGIFKSFVPPLALYALLGLIMHSQRDKNEVGDEEAKS